MRFTVSQSVLALQTNIPCVSRRRILQSKNGIFAFVSKQRMRFAGNQGSAAQQATLRQRCTLITNIPYSSKSRKGYFLQSTRKPDFLLIEVFWRVWDPFFQKRVPTYPLQTSLARCLHCMRMKNPQFRSFLEVLGPFFSKKGPNVSPCKPHWHAVFIACA